MDDWEKFNETSLTEKEDFYSHLNMEHITAEYYAHADRMSWFVCSNDTLLLANVFKNFRKMCLEIYELDPAKCLSAPGLA